MSEIKVGDQVAIGPGTVKWAKEHRHQAVSFGMWVATPHPDEIFPWHPALPALARWWSEHPEVGDQDVVVMLRSDVAALVEYADASRAQNDWHLAHCRMAPSDGESAEFNAILDRKMGSYNAITPEVLARVKEATR